MRKHFFEIKEGDVFCDKQGKVIVAAEDARSPSDCLFVTTPDLFNKTQDGDCSTEIYNATYYENSYGVGEYVDVQHNILHSIEQYE